MYRALQPAAFVEAVVAALAGVGDELLALIVSKRERNIYKGERKAPDGEGEFEGQLGRRGVQFGFTRRESHSRGQHTEHPFHT